LAANLVFQETIERIYAGGLYADVNRGIFIVRGENVLLLGEVVCPDERALTVI
jgi:U6 snRNA-associated Sm-like protein LSm1